MASFVNGCVFTAASAGTGSFVVSAAVTGWQTPAQASAVNGATYRYRAWSIDNTQWEIGTGVYTSGTVTLTRASIDSSSNSGSATNFTLAPMVALVDLAADMVNIASGKSLAISNIMTLAAGADSQTWTFPASSGTIVTLDASQTLTNKTLTSPTLTTPSLGVATATSINGNVFTTGTYTITGAAAKTLTFNNSITLSGTDATTMTFPTTSATIARTDAANTFTGVQTMTSPALTTPAITGISTGSGVATAATVSTLALRDASGNLTAVNLINGFTTTATAAGTTTMTITSNAIQVWTGSSTQTVKLPTTSIVAGGQYWIINQSSGAVTVQSSGANTITILAASTAGLFTAAVATPTTAANWDSRYYATIVTSGKSLSVSNTLTLAGTDATTMTFPSGSGTVLTADSTATLTNKTYDTAGTGNSFSINGVAATANTGTGSVVRAASPTITGTLTAAAVSLSGDITSTGTIGMTLLGTLTTTSGTTQSLTGITAGLYRGFYCEIKAVSFSASATLTINNSVNNGTNYGGSAQNISVATGSGAGAVNGSCFMWGVSNGAQVAPYVQPYTDVQGVGGFSTANPVSPANAGTVNAIQFAGGTFDAGSIDVYGIH